MWKKLKLKRLKRKTEEVQNKLTSLNGSNYITVNWSNEPPEGCNIQGVHECTAGLESIHNHADGAFVVATVSDESPGMGSLFENEGVVQSGFTLDYTTGLVDWDNVTVRTTDHTAVYDDNYLGDGHFHFEMPSNKPKVPCAVCGSNLHNPENFPEDYPDDFKLCCSCKSRLEDLPNVLKRFERFIGKRKREEWAKSV